VAATTRLAEAAATADRPAPDALRLPASDALRLAPLPPAFFARPTEEVARDLLGVLVVRDAIEGRCIGRIVETEAYGGPEDRASHARAGLTRRTAPMFGPAGHAYVYLIYGMHQCLNVVARAGRPAGAVLIRAIEPVEGVELMRARRRRPAETAARLAAGPARLCQALAIDRGFDGHDLTGGRELWLAAPVPSPKSPEPVASGPRIGVAYAGADWAALPWRFWLAGNPSVSR
jgi:DNA-3-methyladenine glycosylase